MDTAPLEVCGVRVLCGASVTELGRKDVVPLSEKKSFVISWYHHHVENLIPANRLSFSAVLSLHSEIFLDRIRKVPVKRVTLEKAGHYPLEQPGIDQLHKAIAEFVENTVIGRD